MMKCLILIIVIISVGFPGCSKKKQAMKELDSLNSPAIEKKTDSPAANVYGKAAFSEDETRKKEIRREAVQDLQSNQKKIAQLMAAEDPFLETSPEAKNSPETLNQFFNRKVYEKLRGNFIFGYHYDEGFTFAGNEFAVDMIKAIPQGRPYLERFKSNFMNAVKKTGMNMSSQSPYRISLCIVAVIPKLQEKPFSYPGMIAEVCLANKITKKAYFMRFGLGKKEGLDLAMQEYSLLILGMMKTSESQVKG